MVETLKHALQFVVKATKLDRVKARTEGAVETVTKLNPIVESLLAQLSDNAYTESVKDLSYSCRNEYEGFKSLFSLSMPDKCSLFQALAVKPVEALLLLEAILKTPKSEYSDIRAMAETATDFIADFYRWAAEHVNERSAPLLNQILATIEEHAASSNPEDDLVEPYDLFLPLREARATARAHAALKRPCLHQSLVSSFPNLEKYAAAQQGLILRFALQLDEFQLAQFRTLVRNLEPESNWAEILSLGINNQDLTVSVLQLLSSPELREPNAAALIGDKICQLPKPTDGYQASEELTGVSLWERNGFVLKRLEKILEATVKNKDLKALEAALSSDKFDKDVSFLVAVARSVGGETPQSFEWHTPETEVTIFKGGEIIHQDEMGNNEFKQPHYFAEAEWNMINEAFEDSYEDYPNWKMILKSNLVKDLNNPHAQFYFVKHKGIPVAVRKVVNKGDNQFHVGTFYVKEAYQGLGATLEKWTLDDLRANATILGTVAPGNEALEGYTERGRIITGVITETAEGGESEPLLRVQTVGKHHFKSSQLSRSEVVAQGQKTNKVNWLQTVQEQQDAHKVITRVCFEGDEVYYLAEPFQEGSSTSAKEALAA